MVVSEDEEKGQRGTRSHPSKHGHKKHHNHNHHSSKSASVSRSQKYGEELQGQCLLPKALQIGKCSEKRWKNEESPLPRGPQGKATSFKQQQPPEKRRKQHYYCGNTAGFLPPYFLLIAPVAIVWYFVFFGFMGLVVGVIVGFYAVCGPVCCFYYARTELWNMYPWHWNTDFYMKITYLLYQRILVGRKQPDCGPETMPTEKMKEKKKLEKYQIPYALNIRIPQGKEEEFQKKKKKNRFDTLQFFEEHLHWFPMSDRFETFEDDEDPVEYVMKQIGNIYPYIYQEWPDKRSDLALVRFCIAGLAAHRVETTWEDGEKMFVVRTNVLAGLPVREGFARYGGDAYFDRYWRPVKIVDAGIGEAHDDRASEIAISHPGDEGWEEAKFRFRSTLSVLVTLVDHLYAIHLQFSNFLTTSMREHLSDKHPVRRFLTPFTFQTISVNDNACHNLIAPRSMGPRCFAFTDRGFSIAVAAAKGLLKGGLEVPPEDGGPMLNREAYTKWLKDKRGIDTPYFRHYLRFWQICKEFVEEYLFYYYPTKEAFVNDLEIKAFFQQYIYQLELLQLGSIKAAPPKTVEDIYSMYVDTIANFMAMVTGGHEQAGAVEIYVQDASFCAFKWVPGKLVGTKQTATAQALLMSFTATPMPQLMGTDWTHLFPGAKDANPKALSPKESFQKFQDQLKAWSAEVDEYNKDPSSRPFPECFPMYVFNPKYMDTSISV